MILIKKIVIHKFINLKKSRQKLTINQKTKKKNKK